MKKKKNNYIPATRRPHDYNIITEGKSTRCSPDQQNRNGAREWKSLSVLSRAENTLVSKPPTSESTYRLRRTEVQWVQCSSSRAFSGTERLAACTSYLGQRCLKGASVMRVARVCETIRIPTNSPIWANRNGRPWRTMGRRVREEKKNVTFVRYTLFVARPTVAF